MDRTRDEGSARSDERLGLEVRSSLYLMSAAIGVLLVATLLGSAIP